MSKNNPQCKMSTKETRALAKELESSYPINEQTILAKIESFQTIYDKDPMYIPSVPEMKSFLDLQAAQGDLTIPVSQISNLRRQVEEGSATMQKIGDTIYIATKNGMIVKVLPNKTMAVINPSNTSDEGIALYQAFDTFFSQTDEDGLEEKEPNKAQRKKFEVLYEDEEVTEAKKKAKEFSIISSTQLGANSAWKIAGENYGIEAIQMSNTETYDDLSAEERASLELP